MAGPIGVRGHFERPLPPPFPPPPVRRRRMAGDRAVPRDSRCRSVGSGNLGGSPRRGAGADPVAPIEGRALPQGLPLSSSPTRLSGTSFAHRGGAKPLRPPPRFPHHPSPPRPTDAPRFSLRPSILLWNALTRP